MKIGQTQGFRLDWLIVNVCRGHATLTQQQESEKSRIGHFGLQHAQSFPLQGDEGPGSSLFPSPIKIIEISMHSRLSLACMYIGRSEYVYINSTVGKTGK